MVFFIFSLLIEQFICKQTVETLIRHQHCLPVSNKKYARLIWVNGMVNGRGIYVNPYHALSLLAATFFIFF